MIHICLSTNQNYVKLTKMCIYDIIARKAKDTEITFYILADKLSEQHDFDCFNKINNIKCITIQLDSDIIVPDLNMHYLMCTRPGLPRTMYLRFLIPILNEFQNVERVLYIDPDMLARRDLTDLYNTDLCGQPLGMVRDSFYIRFENWDQVLEEHKNGYNAGLILMDLPKLRELNFTNRCLYTARFNRYNDQTAINCAMRDQVKALPPYVQFPIHNLIQHIQNMDNLEKWNLFHGTAYQHWSEILDCIVFYHFHEDKSWQMQIPVLKSAWDFSEQRLHRFEETGIIEPIENDKLIDQMFLSHCSI